MPTKTANIPEEIPITSSIRGFKYLTLQGGGMKGIGDVGAIEELEKNGVLAQLEEVAGTSAGGLMATLLAIGCTAEEIRGLVLTLDFRSLQDKSELGWIESMHLKDVAKAGIDLASDVTDRMNAIRNIPVIGNLLNGVTKPYRVHVDAVLDNVAEYGKTAITALSFAEKAEEIAALALGTELGLWKGEALTYWLAKIIAQKTGNPNITFKELAALSQTQGSLFKKLTLTGSNTTDEIREYYNAENTPNMSIIEAARISGSFPGGYKPVVTMEEGEDGKKRRVVRVDGGLLENLPDVFNKEPYFSGGKGGNPKVLALSFETPHRKEASKDMKPAFDYFQGIYKTKMSEKKLIEKYGPNIAFIDTKGVGTLEFDASDEKRMELAESGASAIRKTFDNILKKEMESKKDANYYHNISDEELMRIIIELKHTKKLSPKMEREYNEFSKELRSRKHSKLIERSSEEWKELEEKTEETYERKQKLLNPTILTDSELSQVCQMQMGELKRIEKQQEKDLERLKLAKVALEFDRGEMLDKFKENNGKNKFHHDLVNLADINKRITNKLGEIRDSESEAEAEKKEKEYEALKAEKENLHKEISNRYQNNDSFSGFFSDLKKDSDEAGFEAPDDDVSLYEYCSQDIDQCGSLIEAVEEEIEETKKQLQLFRYQQAAFTDRSPKSEQFSSLLGLKAELDACINSKTTFIIKVNNYLTKKAPKLQRVVTPFLKMVAFSSFVCCLASVTIIPIFPYAKAVEKFSKNPETRETARKFMNWFKKSDIDFDIKLKELREVTVSCIKKMNSDYVESDVSENTYLHKLHAQYLKNSGIDLESIFEKKSNESDDEYKERVKEARKKFEFKSTDSEEEKIEQFKMDVVELTREEKLCFEFIHEIDLKIKRKETLEHEEVKKYIENAMTVGREIPNKLHLQFIQYIDLKEKNKEKLSYEELQWYIEGANATGKKIPGKIHLEFIEQIDKKIMHLKNREMLTDKEIKEYIESAKALNLKKLSDVFQSYYKKISDGLREKFREKTIKDLKLTKIKFVSLEEEKEIFKFIDKINLKIKENKELTEEEVRRYVQGSEALKEKLPKLFSERYRDILNKIKFEFIDEVDLKVKNKKSLTEEEVNKYIESSKMLEKNLSPEFINYNKTVLNKISKEQKERKSREFMREMDLQIKHKKPLTEQEVNYYMELSKEMGKELSKTFLQANKEILDKITKEQKIKEATEEHAPFKKGSELTKKAVTLFMDERTKKHGHQHGKLDIHDKSHPQKPYHPSRPKKK